jgi:hypothetical protein
MKYIFTLFVFFVFSSSQAEQTLEEQILRLEQLELKTKEKQTQKCITM